MEPSLELEWLIHYKCSYRCPYCFFEGMWDEVEKRNVRIPLQKWIDAWERLRRNYGLVRIIITGGEPFIYPDFVDLVQALSRNLYIAFDTNLSCPEGLLCEFVKKTVPDNIVMGLSFHPFFANFDSFLSKALFLRDNGYKVCVQYVSYPEQIADLPSYKARVEAHGLYFIPIPFRGRYKDKAYPQAHTDEEKKLIYNSIVNLAGEHKDRVEKQLNQVKTKGKLCRAGQVYARIDNEGSVYRCGHYVSSDYQALGNFFDDNFKLSKIPLPCEEETCPCEFRWVIEQ